MNNSQKNNNGHRSLTWERLEPWNDPVEGAPLLEELRDVFTNYVVLPKSAPEMLALWTLHTYAFQLRNVTTYVGVSSPEKRCGKTTLLALLSKLVNRPLAAANISPPALFRVIEEVEPTLLIDEADTFLQGNDEMRGILNAGYSRDTAYVVRVSGEKPRTPQSRDAEESSQSRPTSLARFSCWCPKVMAAIGRLPDTLADRCIVLRMQRKTAAEQCQRLKDLDATILRRKCARFVNDQALEISAASPDLPRGLNDRAADIWEPLFALAELAGGNWPLLAREASRALSGTAADSNLIGLLLIQIHVEFSRVNAPKIFSRDLVKALNALDNRPWAEGLKGQRIDETWLANRLRPYGVRPKNIWIKGDIARGYSREDFADMFSRYITRADLDELRPKPDETTPTPNPQPSESTRH